MIEIETDRICEGTILIISHNTGVLYSAQSGGVGCAHPSLEGYAICLGGFAENLTGCEYGCSHLAEMPDAQKQFADIFNGYCNEETKRWTYQISFDYDRIKELQEAWIPVLLNGKMDDVIFNNTKAIISNGNCD